MPPRNAATVRSSARTVAGLYKALAEATLTRREIVRATAAAVRAAWDEGGGDALASMELSPTKDRRGDPIEVGADLIESALSAVEAWSGGSSIPADAREAYWNGANAACIDLAATYDKLNAERKRRPTTDLTRARDLRAIAALLVTGAVRSLAESLRWQRGEEWPDVAADARGEADAAPTQRFVTGAGAAARLAAMALYALGHGEDGPVEPWSPKRRNFGAAEQRVVAIVRAKLREPSASPSQRLQSAMDDLAAGSPPARRTNPSAGSVWSRGACLELAVAIQRRLPGSRLVDLVEPEDAMRHVLVHCGRPHHVVVSWRGFYLDEYGLQDPEVVMERWNGLAAENRAGPLRAEPHVAARARECGLKRTSRLADLAASTAERIAAAALSDRRATVGPR